MDSETWFDRFVAGGGARDLPADAREGLARLDSKLFTLWNLGDNLLLGWTRDGDDLLVLSVRHYAIPEMVHREGAAEGAQAFINEVLAGGKYLEPAEFERVSLAFQSIPCRVQVDVRIDSDRLASLVDDMVRCYGVSLMRNRAVVLLDAVEFALQAPLDQVAMLNSLSYSVTSAYGQLLSKGIKIDFARTSTGDGFYIWNRANTAAADNELYTLLMMLLADNEVARSKASGSWVPKLRAAFHVGEHYEFNRVVGLSPTGFGYIVGQVTVDLARMLDRALPGQILIGDFAPDADTTEFIENTAATLEQLKGAAISGGRVDEIRCYLTGRREGKGTFGIDRYLLRDRHGAMPPVYNAKINIHRDEGGPIFLGLRQTDLWAFNAAKVESLTRHPG